MKILQLNAWCCKLSTEIVRLLEQERPDIITMQEMVHTEKGAKILDTLSDIFSSYPFSDYYFTPLVEFSFMHGRAQRGNLIAANFPIVHKDQIWTEGEFIQDFDYQESGGYNAARNIAHATISTPLGMVHVLTLHGYHLKGHKNGNSDTFRACSELIEYASSLEGPIIATGDFNLSPESESIQLLDQNFRNLSVEAGLKTTRNHLTSKTEVCDYIFVNDKIQIINFSMSNSIVSDHNALILDFELKT